MDFRRVLFRSRYGITLAALLAKTSLPRIAGGSLNASGDPVGTANHCARARRTASSTSSVNGIDIYADALADMMYAYLKRLIATTADRSQVGSAAGRERGCQYG